MLIQELLKKINIKFRDNPQRLTHILGVHRKAIQLARFYNEDIQKAQIAALMHDYTKNESLNFHVSLLSKDIINKYQDAPFIYHAFSAAIIAEKEFQIIDRKILNAIKRHVWGHLRMNKLDKIIFISDKTENNRNYPEVDYFRQLSLQNIDKAMYFILKSKIEHYILVKKNIFPEQLEILNFFKNKI